jgi:hypothetical protein
MGEREEAATQRPVHCLLVSALLVALVTPARSHESRAGQAQPPPSDAPHFRLSASPGAVTVRRGATAEITVKVEPASGLQAQVNLLSSLLYETKTSFAPPVLETGSGSAVLAIAPSASAIKGEYTLSITGVGGGLSSSTTVRVTIK